MKSSLNSKAKLLRQESDLIISPGGEVTISFLWEDLTPTFAPERTVPALTPPRNVFVCDGASPAFPSQEYEACVLCPKKCGFNRLGAVHPTCGDSQLRVACAGLSMGDEPSIRGQRGSGVIMLSGCPLKCPSCHNPEMVATGEPYSLSQFLKLAEQLVNEGGENIQILSPTVHFPALRVLLTELKAAGIPVPILFKSSGYESVEQLKPFEGLVDIYLPDLKFGSCSNWAARAAAPHYFEITVRAVQEMLRQVGALRVDHRGVATRGLLVRHVQAPLPTREKEEINRFLGSLPPECVSYLSHFSQL